MNQQLQNRITKDTGEFVALPSGMATFSRHNPFPMIPWTCPCCGHMTKHNDNKYLVRYGMCMKCCVWWETELQISLMKPFKEKVDKFLHHLEKLREIPTDE